MLSARLTRFGSCGLMALVLTGCSLTPYSPSHRSGAPVATPTSATATTPRAAEPTEHDGPVPAAPGGGALAAAAPTPQQAIALYGRLYVNWNVRTLRAVQHKLAAISTGQAQAQAQAASRAPLTRLLQYQVSNSGQVVAIAPGRGPESGTWVVVTRERTSGLGPYLGLPVTVHVTWAMLIDTAKGWVVSAWLPAS